MTTMAVIGGGPWKARPFFKHLVLEKWSQAKPRFCLASLKKAREWPFSVNLGGLCRGYPGAYPSNFRPSQPT